MKARVHGQHARSAVTVLKKEKKERGGAADLSGSPATCPEDAPITIQPEGKQAAASGVC